MAELPPTHVVTDYEELADTELMTGEAVALDLRPTGFVLRAAGSAIDFVLYFGGYIAGMVIFLQATASVGLDEALTASVAIVGLVLFLLVVPIAVETISHGKSLGRLAVGARIVRDDGGAIGFRHSFVRALVGVFEIFMTFGGTALIVGLLNPRAKRLGDLLAGTYSQHERVPALVAPVYGVPLPLLEWSRTADVARMPDALARRIAQFLAQANGMGPDTRIRLARSLATEASVYVSPLPEYPDAEYFIAAVAALRRDREMAALTLEQRRLESLRPVLQGLPHGFPQR